MGRGLKYFCVYMTIFSLFMQLEVDKYLKRTRASMSSLGYQYIFSLFMQLEVDKYLKRTAGLNVTM